MNILIYYPYNLRSVEQQSVMELLIRKGYKVILLTSCPEGPLHSIARELGVSTEYISREPTNKFRFYLKNLQKLYKTVKEYQIDIVIAHQQKPALIAGLVNKVLPFQLFYVRHNSDEDYLSFPVKARWLNRIVNFITREKIAPSGIVQRFWIEKEKVRAGTIQRINYGYNFRQYETPDIANSVKIRARYPAQLLLLSMARMVPSKRHLDMFAIVQRIRAQGVDCRMICLGEGPLRESLEKAIRVMNLESSIHLLGRKENIFDFIYAADVFVHLSSTEASNSAVKEVGLCKRPVIVCRGVGDFEEYIVHRKNSFLVPKEDPVPEACTILQEIAAGTIDRLAIGEKLYKTVIEQFDIGNVAAAYERLLGRSQQP